MEGKIHIKSAIDVSIDVGGRVFQRALSEGIGGN